MYRLARAIAFVMLFLTLMLLVIGKSNVDGECAECDAGIGAMQHVFITGRRIVRVAEV